MTDQEVNEIQARCDHASPGPWRAWIEGRDHTSGSSFIQTGADDIEMSGATNADYDFIANARQDVPRLLEEIRRLRAEARGQGVNPEGKTAISLAGSSTTAGHASVEAGARHTTNMQDVIAPDP